MTEARKLVGQMSDIMIQVTRFVLEVTPIGTFGLIAGLVGSYGFEKLLPLGHFVLALCGLRHIVVVYSAAAGARPEPVLPRRGAGHAGGLRQLVQLRRDAGGAFDHPLGVHKDYGSFAVPLGASIKMDGCGAIIRRCARCSSRSTAVCLTPEQYVVVLIASVLAASVRPACRVPR